VVRRTESGLARLVRAVLALRAHAVCDMTRAADLSAAKQERLSGNGEVGTAKQERLSGNGEVGTAKQERLSRKRLSMNGEAETAEPDWLSRNG
jgi:hypothetical protein